MIAIARMIFVQPFARFTAGQRQTGAILLLTLAFAALPMLLDDDSTTDTIANAMSYATLALGLNIVVGFAGLLDLGYAAFFAIGAYYYGIFTAYQVMPIWHDFWGPFAFLGLVEKINQGGPDLVHFTLSFWIALPTAAAVSAFFGVLFGAPSPLSRWASARSCRSWRATSTA
jgi:branched-chain amino acid transport system permease protein